VATKKTTSSKKPKTSPYLVDLNAYKFQNATIQDLQKKYGFDFSRQYAQRVAQMERMAKQSGLESQLKSLESDYRSAQDRLSRDYFQQFLNTQQNVVNRGLNAGLQADQFLRLNMSRQQALADMTRDYTQRRGELQQQLANLALEEQQRAEQLYQERLQQAFENLMALDETQLRNLDLRLQADMFNRQQALELYRHNTLSAAQREEFRLGWARLQEEKRQFNSEMEWRRYTYNNMSAYERAQLDAEIRMFGEELAWRRKELELSQKYALRELAVQAIAEGADPREIEKILASMGK